MLLSVLILNQKVSINLSSWQTLSSKPQRLRRPTQALHEQLIIYWPQLKPLSFLSVCRSNRFEGGDSRVFVVHGVFVAAVRGGWSVLRVPYEATTSVELYRHPAVCRRTGMFRSVQSRQQLCDGKCYTLSSFNNKWGIDGSIVVLKVKGRRFFCLSVTSGKKIRQKQKDCT